MDPIDDGATVDTAQAAAEALERGDFVALRGLLAEDVVWYANGDPANVGTYEGRDEVIAALRVQRAQGQIATSGVTEVDEPEVQAFGVGPMGAPGARYFSVKASTKGECKDTESVVQVRGPVITSFGSIPAPRVF